MADEKPTLHVDSDWKKQAQEEKKRLAEEQAKKAAAPAPATQASQDSRASSPASPGTAGPQNLRKLPPPSFSGLAQTLMTQILYYLGDVQSRGRENSVDLDLARHHIDTLAILEDKTKNNLTAEEKQVLEMLLYEARMRFINVASQIATYP